MKISHLHPQKDAMSVNQAKASDPPEKSPVREKTDGRLSGDTVELSSRSREMQKVQEVLQRTPDVRTEKVVALKKLIQEGKYQIDNKGLAEKMIRESVLDLIV